MLGLKLNYVSKRGPSIALCYHNLCLSMDHLKGDHDPIIHDKVTMIQWS